MLLTLFLVFLCWMPAQLVAQDLDPIATVTIDEHQAMRVNGEPFFPIMSWAQHHRRFELLRSLHFNTFNSSGGGSVAEVIDAAEAVGAYTMIHWNKFQPALADHPRILAYSLRDEPDMGINKGEPRVSAAEVLAWGKQIRGQDDSRPVFLNFTGQFKQDQGGDGPGVTAYYRQCSKAADILCFDLYPIYQQNRDDRLIWVAEGVSELQQIADHQQPVWAWIETSKGSKWITYEKQKDVTPQIIRSETWMAIIRGARGIGYFTHAWRPSFKEFAPDEAAQKEIKRNNALITTLTPVILAEPPQLEAAIKFEQGLHGEIMVRRYREYTYIFANNLDMEMFDKRDDKRQSSYRAGRATISMAGLKAGTEIEVLAEGREIQAEEAGRFSDDFGPLAVHIYRYRHAKD